MNIFLNKNQWNKFSDEELENYKENVFKYYRKHGFPYFPTDEQWRKNEFDKVVEILTKISKAEQAAERARKQVMEAVKDIEKNQRRKVFASDKLKDAEHLGQSSILLAVEGNSAAASMAISRDVKKYGILSLRGN